MIDLVLTLADGRKIVASLVPWVLVLGVPSTLEDARFGLDMMSEMIERTSLVIPQEIIDMERR